MAFAGNKVLGIIPARGGSKGLPKKNIVALNGQPLIAYSINAGLHSKYIDAVLVSSNDLDILQIAEKYNAEVLVRPNELATDSASIHQVIAHAIESVNSLGREFDLAILLQPTSPLRTTKHIDDAFEHLKKFDTMSLISVYIPEKSPYKCFVLGESGYLKGFVNNDVPFKNRQELPEVFMPNGAIYIFSIKDFLRNNRIPVENAIPFIMSERESIDIDIQEDIDMAEKILKHSYRGYHDERV